MWPNAYEWNMHDAYWGEWLYMHTLPSMQVLSSYEKPAPTLYFLELQRLVYQASA